MKPGIPKPASVDAAFRVLEKRLLAVQKRVNLQASRALKGGQYDATNQWMEIGKLVADFAARADHFATEWRRVVRAAKVGPTTPRTDPAIVPSPADISCPICGDHVFRRTRGGWDAHVGSLRKHPKWHPDIEDPDERKALFQKEFPSFFGR